MLNPKPIKMILPNDEVITSEDHGGESEINNYQLLNLIKFLLEREEKKNGKEYNSKS